MIITGIRFNKNFPITNMKDCAIKHVPAPWNSFHRWKDLNMLEDFAQMMRGFGQCWHFPSWLTRKWPDDQSG